MHVPTISPVTQLSGNGFGQNGSKTNVGATSAPPLCFASIAKPNTAPSTTIAAPAYKKSPRFTISSYNFLLIDRFCCRDIARRNYGRYRCIVTISRRDEKQSTRIFKPRPLRELLVFPRQAK